MRDRRIVQAVRVARSRLVPHPACFAQPKLEVDIFGGDEVFSTSSEPPHHISAHQPGAETGASLSSAQLVGNLRRGIAALEVAQESALCIHAGKGSAHR